VRSWVLTRWKFVFCCALGAAIISCGTRSTRESTGINHAAIVGGETSPSPTDDAVVLIHHSANGVETLCSATLVAPNLIVTARHCVSYVIDGPYACTVTGELVEGPDGAGNVGLHVPAALIEIYVGAEAGATPAAMGQQVLSTLSLTSCVSDLAFVVLDRPLAPVAAVRIGKQTRVGEAVTLVGYGKQGDGEYDWRTQPRNKKTGQVIAAVGPDSTQGTVPTSVPNSFDIHGASSCDGDSGGPALSDQTGAVIGVYSNRSNSDCLNQNIIHSYVNLAPFGKLTADAFAAAGAEPKREPPGLAMGDACQQASECERGDCAASKDGIARCTVTCGALAPCPGGYSCVPNADASGKVCVANTLPSCPCGSPSCPACDAGDVAPPPPTSATSEGGCVISRAEPRGLWLFSVLAALAVLRASPFICKRGRSPHRARNRSPTRIRTAGW